MFGGIDAQPINPISLHQPLDPIIHSRHYTGIFGVQVREGQVLVADPALLDVGLVIVVSYEAVGVEVRCFREGHEFGKIEGCVDGCCDAGCAHEAGSTA